MNWKELNEGEHIEFAAFLIQEAREKETDEYIAVETFSKEIECSNVDALYRTAKYYVDI